MLHHWCKHLSQKPGMSKVLIMKSLSLTMVAPMLVALMPIIGLPYCLVVIMFQLRITLAVHPCAMQCYVRADTSGVL